MGGDYGPKVVVPAAIRALKQDKNLNIILVGKTSEIEPYLKKADEDLFQRIELQEATQVISMDEEPATAMRRKKDSSMRVALDLVKSKKADACVSAGNTGALMAISKYVLKTVSGISRPAIVRPLPTMNSSLVYVLDLGANVDCTPENLEQFAIMGSTLVEYLHPTLVKPKVGLLNIGSESIKGNDVVKKTNEVLEKNTLINYDGYVEGDDIYKGTVDVVVCDGFVGNIVLKASEGLAKMVLKFAKQEFTRSWYTKLLAFLCQPVLKALNNIFNPGKYNGASLLGLKGIVVKSHGNANVEAFVQAIQAAKSAAKYHIAEKIEAKLTSGVTKSSKVEEVLEA